MDTMTITLSTPHIFFICVTIIVVVAIWRNTGGKE